MKALKLKLLVSVALLFAALSLPAQSNLPWLEMAGISNGVAGLNLRGAGGNSNTLWGIETTPGLAQPFTLELALQPTNDCQPFTLTHDGWSQLFVRAEDVTGGSSSDGVPNVWSFNYWGTLPMPTTNLDYSGNGLTFAQEYFYNTDYYGYNYYTPTVFAFTNLAVPNNYVRTTASAVQLEVAGSPYYVATLMDDNSFSNAVWQTYTGTNVPVNLGNVEGWHDVWVGLRGHGDAPDAGSWQWKRLKLDVTPPALVITNPASATVGIPLVQVQGFSSEDLGAISYDLTNAAGMVTNQPVLVLNRDYDPNTMEFTTNYFQAFDVVLTNGVNTLTLHATDRAGNVTTLVTNFTLDYSGQTNAPNLQIVWPPNGEKIANSSVTIRGQVADATVQVTAAMTDTNGNTNTITGMVERTGRFWLDNLPLTAGTNSVLITATDAAGNTTNTTLNVVQDPMTLTLDAIANPAQLWQPTINLTGQISDPTATIYVNGVQGTNHGDGTWSAANVPVPKGGVATFDLNAIPAGGGDPANSANADKPWQVYVYSDTQTLDTSTDSNWTGWEDNPDDPRATDGDEDYDDTITHHYDHTWSADNGGDGSTQDAEHKVDWDGTPYDTTTSSTLTWTSGGAGTETDTANDGSQNTYDIGPPVIGNEHCHVNDPTNAPPVNQDYSPVDGDADDDETYTYRETYTRTADTVWHVQTGGRAVPGLQNLWRFTATATAILDKRATPPFAGANTRPIDPTQINIGSMGNLGTSGTLTKLLPNGAEMDITPTVAGNDFYTFSVSGQKYCSYFEVFVNQPTPGTQKTYSDTAGHAFFRFYSDASNDLLQSLYPSLLPYATNSWGFYPQGTAYWGTTRGYLADDSHPTPHGENVSRVFYIGFSEFIAGLTYAKSLKENPPNYSLADGRLGTSCVFAAIAAGAWANITLPHDWLPQNFGADILLQFPGAPDDSTPRYSQ